jgi:uncharacterized membrane protein
MASFVNCFFISLLLFIVLDLLWFRIFAYKNIYKPQFNLINRFSRNDKKKRALLSALIAWVLMAITVSVFLVDFKPDSNNAEAFSFGMLIGFLIYGIYNFTNYATINNYKIKTLVSDTIWGTFLFGIVSLIVKQI